ncbi:MAG: polysaccharide pyruvyl transferase [Dactylosporangium sp.]|nr:polysaccharide pyruvyl transferase family protein [Dactylosporangium sp.]NNJ61392.1 polysaccharide pyruvyl transferase [Dactylosporangium sp.]
MVSNERGPLVGVLGSYGGRNLGDEAILTSLLADLRARRPDARILVFSRDPDHTVRAHPGIEAVGWKGPGRGRTTAGMDRLDLLVLGGGGILYDTEARHYLRLVRAAQEQAVPVFVHALGAGPLTEETDRAMVREALASTVDVTVRDAASRAVLKEVGVTQRVTVTADPALLLEPEIFPIESLRAEGVPPGPRLIGVSVREPGPAAEHLDVGGYHQFLAQLGDALVPRFDARLLFVPMERTDIRHAQTVRSQMAAGEHCRILSGDCRPRQVLGLMRHLDLAVGMRLHFLMFAALAGIPLLPLPYAGKVLDFAQRAGAPALRGAASDLVGPLLAEADRLGDVGTARTRQPAGRIAALRQRAARTGEHLGAVLDQVCPAPLARAG